MPQDWMVDFMYAAQQAPRRYNPTGADGSDGNHPSLSRHSPLDPNERTKLPGLSTSYGTMPPYAPVRGGHEGPRSIFLVIVAFIIGYILCEPINRTRHEATRRGWQGEVDRQNKLRSDMNNERQIFEAEKVSWKIERDQRALEEKQRIAEEQRQRESISWANVTASSQCLTYGAREYTAILMNVPLGFHAIEECQKKPVEIHGRKWLPSVCEDKGVCGRVTGHWIVNVNEGGCMPFWSWFRDKGCVQPTLRRYEAPLENYNNDNTWQEMCSTTPAIINGVRYDGPHSCADWGKYGKWGIWFVKDAKCT